MANTDDQVPADSELEASGSIEPETGDQTPDFEVLATVPIEDSPVGQGDEPAQSDGGSEPFNETQPQASESVDSESEVAPDQADAVPDQTAGPDAAAESVEDANAEDNLDAATTVDTPVDPVPVVANSAVEVDSAETVESAPESAQEASGLESDNRVASPAPIPILSTPPQDFDAANLTLANDGPTEILAAVPTESSLDTSAHNADQDAPNADESQLAIDETAILTGGPIRDAIEPGAIEPGAIEPGPEQEPKVALKQTKQGPKAKQKAKGSASSKNRGRKALIGTAVGIVVLAGAYTGGQWLVSDNVARGTTVAGVEIGGLQTDAAVTKLEESLGGVLDTPVELAALDLTTTIVPHEAGVVFDAKATIAGLTDFSMDPMILWSHIVGGDAIQPVLTIDEQKLDTEFSAAAQSLLTEPTNGSVGFEGTKAVMTDAIEGTEVDVPAAKDLLIGELFTKQRPLALPTQPIEPEINAQEAAAAFAQAEKMASGPVTVAVGEQKAEIPVDAFIPVTSFHAEDGNLEVNVDAEALAKAVIERTDKLLAPAKNAEFKFENGKPVIVAGKAGTSLDPEALKTAFVTAATGTERTATTELVTKDPERGVTELEAMGVKEKVATFSTPITNERQRNLNLSNAAEKITGYLVEPGKEFDLLKIIGPITADNGYHNAGVVVNGVHTDGMGGGLSQVATTTYNTGFFAGMADVTHRPHSYYFGRYPAGREATLYVGSIDMIWRNDSPHGVLMRAYLADGKLTVEAWSTKTYEVKESTSGRYNVVPIRMVNSTDAKCKPFRGGNPGFGVTISRTVTEIATGKVVIDEKNSWTYKPDNGVTCNKPEPKTETND